METKQQNQSQNPWVLSGERRVPASEIVRRAEHAAEGFRRLGVAEGDAIAVLMRNDVAFFEVSNAANFAGAYAVPINWHGTTEEVAFVILDCAAKALVVHEDLLPAVIDAIPPGLPVLVVSTPAEIAVAYQLAPKAPESQAGRQTWDAFVGANPPIASRSITARQPVFYTSGTTGRPKGVQRLPMDAAAPPPGATAFGFDLEHPITILMNGPMYHTAPNVYGMGGLKIGANLVLQARFDAEEMLMLIERERISHMHIVPTMFVRLLKLPESVRARYDTSSLRFVIHGAAPCPSAVKKAMIEWWGPVIFEYYGSTETGLVCWHDSREALLKPGTVGRALPEAALKVLDPQGRELGAGEEGEVYMRSSALPDFTYIGLADKRAEVGRGELVTVGDIGRLDEDGYLFLCDRKRDMIISGGVNIYPAEIEAQILSLKGVKDCAVFGIPNDDFGESVCAYIQTFESEQITEVAVKDHLAQRLARFKLPREIRFVTDLPREDSGKVFKRKLREPYWAGRNNRI